ncbi:hypothetical protein LZ009_09010 [Ramlibacter sp. XY19]|uniref:hypothetical protein n=1 Tax=Ramlibacter paludis TaxID=2908000 RepID=UPI0023DAEACD|nr:hypothetical protein [Ramlibacter paludis]MCG2592918.1 hypothetical protein [Ramlibacter paludis]
MPLRHILSSAFLATLTACGGSASGEHYSIQLNPPQTCPSAPCVTTVAGSGQPGNADGTAIAAQFSFPYADAATDSAGNRYAADPYGNRILVTTPDGRTSVLAGTGSSGDEDGAAGAASFSMPTGLAFGADGALYVADMGNRKIRKITFD